MIDYSTEEMAHMADYMRNLEKDNELMVDEEHEMRMEMQVDREEESN